MRPQHARNFLNSIFQYDQESPILVRHRQGLDRLGSPQTASIIPPDAAPSIILCNECLEPSGRPAMKVSRDSLTVVSSDHSVLPPPWRTAVRTIVPAERQLQTLWRRVPATPMTRALPRAPIGRRMAPGP